jgi:DNA polymerase V
VPGDDASDGGLDLNDLLITNPDSTFFVRVAGDSMEGAGIFDGDILVVDRSRQPTVGAIVVAAVAGELTVKRVGERSGQTVLVPENPAYPPLVPGDDEECHIWGVVIGSVRQFEAKPTPSTRSHSPRSV